MQSRKLFFVIMASSSHLFVFRQQQQQATLFPYKIHLLVSPRLSCFMSVCCRDLPDILQKSEHFFLCSKWRHCYFIRIFLAVIDLFRKCSGATSVRWSNDDVINDRVERHLADYIFRKQALLRSRGRQYGINTESIIDTESIFNE